MLADIAASSWAAIGSVWLIRDQNTGQTIGTTPIRRSPPLGPDA